MAERRIVVGIEGSGYARAALIWALEEAAFRGAVVEAVTAYSPTYVPAAPDLGYVPIDSFDLVTEVDCSACGGNRLRPDVAAVGSRAIPSDRSAPCHSMKHSGCRARRNSVATRRRSPETCCAKRPAG